MPLKKTAQGYRRRLRQRLPEKTVRTLAMYRRMKARVLLDFSQDLLSKMRNSAIQGKVIFLGQGMRPLFDAVTELNNALKLVPRNKIRYFIYSRNSYPRTGSAAKNLKRLRIADGKTKDFVIIDYEDNESLIGRFGQELKIAERNAAVRHITEKSSSFEDIPETKNALILSEDVRRLTVTTRQKKGQAITYEPNNQEQVEGPQRKEYLTLQYAIKREVERRRKKYPH